MGSTEDPRADWTEALYGPNGTDVAGCKRNVICQYRACLYLALLLPVLLLSPMLLLLNLLT